MFLGGVFKDNEAQWEYVLGVSVHHMWITIAVIAIWALDCNEEAQVQPHADMFVTCYIPFIKPLVGWRDCACAFNDSTQKNVREP